MIKAHLGAGRLIPLSKDPTKLNVDILLAAYCHGYFPMPDGDQGLIRWFRPDPRAVMPLAGFHCSHSLRKVIKAGTFTCSVNLDFPAVIRGCADRPDTWINQEFTEKYTELHQRGFAHSLEIWSAGRLAGGVYGVAIGGAFFAESMFHRVSNASKVALFYLVERLAARGFVLMEVQFLTPHLRGLGAVEVPDASYMEQLRRACRLKRNFD